MRLLNCSLLLGMLVLFTGCSAKHKDEKLNVIDQQLKEIYKVDLKDDVKQVVFINDNTCPNCVESFSNFILNNIDKYKDNSLIVINSSGRNVDLDRFNSLELKNIIYSNQVKSFNELIPNLGIAYIKDSRLDTIVALNAETFADQLEYIVDHN